LADGKNRVDRLSPNHATVDPEEVARFAAQAAEWWDPRGPYASLHKLNPVRLAFIREQALARFARDGAARRPFEGLRLLDIGCGGGLLSEPMARLGFAVVAADAEEETVRTAAAHADEMGLEIDYRTTSAEALIESGESFDVVLNMEVIEHVADASLFLESCTTLLRPQGLMLLSTLNRTWRSFGLGVVAAEYVLGWVPKGTHDWNKFITPAELRDMSRPLGLKICDITGMSYDPLTDEWHRSTDLSVNYLAALSHS
jgi:2-polyprenyl-6-hydroxyphenyl methylase/3-demethylubiquinone-9 3-methyltransferase